MKAARFTALAAACLALSRPAYADDAATIKAKIATAAAFVRSYVVLMQFTGTTGAGGTITIVRPGLLKSEMNVGHMTVETYLIGNTVYFNSPVAGWQKTTFDLQHLPQQALDIAAMIKKSQTTLLPDRQENGMTVGVINIETAVPATAAPIYQQGAANLICSYNKTSFLMQTCTNGLLTMQYTKYNDAANAVVLPDAAKHAEPVVIKTPAPTLAAPTSPVETVAPQTTNPRPAPTTSSMPLNPTLASPPASVIPTTPPSN